MGHAADHPLAVHARRAAKPAMWVSIVLIIGSFLVLANRLPVEQGIASVKDWLQAQGAWAVALFALAYCAATVLMIPGAPLTIAAGGLFGLWTGTLVVLVGATSGASVAFLLARRFTRHRVQRLLEAHPTLAAIQKAVGKGDWRLVALLRLSPAIPFNLQNYAYGLTSIRFWPYVLASLVFMLPGTFLYVCLGDLAAASVSPAPGGLPGDPALRWTWAFRVVGLLATVAATLYVTRLARDSLKEQVEVGVTEVQHAKAVETKSTPAWPWGATIAALFAALFVGTAVYAMLSPSFLGLGPPQVNLREAYGEKPDGPVIDHSVLDALLKAHVDTDGYVDYAALRKDEAKLDAYLESLKNVPEPDKLDRNEILALRINAYNAFTLKLILEHYQLASIRDIPKAKRWAAVRWRIGTKTYSLDQIEHEQIRPKFSEPRVHWALVCAAIGCPKLRNEAYAGSRVEAQLQDQAVYVHSHPRWFRYDAKSDTVSLTRLYSWYGGDFKQADGSILAHAAQFDRALKERLVKGDPPKTEFLPYDWKLNDKKNRPGKEAGE